jgi:hypothetical protein
MPEEVAFDLNEYLSERFTDWHSVYLRDASDDQRRLCAAAFAEGAKVVQLLMLQAVLETAQGLS